APYAQTLRTLLDSHEPYPGSAYDPLGRIQMTNAAHRRLFPGASERTPEESIDLFFRDGAGLEFENWPEVAWAYADRWRLEASRYGSTELRRLAARAEAHLADVPRPTPSPDDGAVMSPRIRIDGRTYRTFSTVLRFDTARELTLSEIRVELIYPADEDTAALFRLAAASAA
ncbi:MAG: hypothetical protein QNK05_25195, partial [Myxococcota bacterium]|nr:hypothetical protein [Myxococcota bacterium]